MMTPEKIEEVILRSEGLCRELGYKLTDKRKKVLVTLLHSETPLSAYEVADCYKNEFEETIPAMSVYRMLDFLMKANLVHKLSSTNKFIACSHIVCKHDHQVPQFLICDSCNVVTEIGINKETIDALRQGVETAGFALQGPQLELHGFCKNCRDGA